MGILDWFKSKKVTKPGGQAKQVAKTVSNPGANRFTNVNSFKVGSWEKGGHKWVGPHPKIKIQKMLNDGDISPKDLISFKGGKDNDRVYQIPGIKLKSLKKANPNSKSKATAKKRTKTTIGKTNMAHLKPTNQGKTQGQPMKKKKPQLKKKSPTTSDSIVQPKGAGRQSAKSRPLGKTVELQKLIDKTASKGELNLDVNLGEYQGPVTIRKPIKIIGKNHVIWSKKGPVLSVEKGETILQDLSIEITVSDHSKLSEEETMALAVSPSATIKTNKVLVRGNVKGVTGEEGTWDYPPTINLGSLRPEVSHEFKIELLIPIKCKIRCDISGLVLNASNASSGSTTLTLLLEGMGSGTRLRGKITIESGMLSRQIPINANISDSKSKKAIKGNGEVIWKPEKSTLLDLANQIVKDLTLKKSDVIEFGSPSQGDTLEFAEFLEVSDKGMIKLRKLEQATDATLRVKGRPFSVCPEDYAFKKIDCFVLPMSLAKQEGWRDVKLPKGSLGLKAWNDAVESLTCDVRVVHNKKLAGKMQWKAGEIIKFAKKVDSKGKWIPKKDQSFAYGEFDEFSNKGMIKLRNLEQDKTGKFSKVSRLSLFNPLDYAWDSILRLELPDDLEKKGVVDLQKAVKGPFTLNSWNQLIDDANLKNNQPRARSKKTSNRRLNPGLGEAFANSPVPEESKGQESLLKQEEPKVEGGTSLKAHEKPSVPSEPLTTEKKRSKQSSLKTSVFSMNDENKSKSPPPTKEKLNNDKITKTKKSKTNKIELKGFWNE